LLLLAMGLPIKVVPWNQDSSHPTLEPTHNAIVVGFVELAGYSQTPNLPIIENFTTMLFTAGGTEIPTTRVNVLSSHDSPPSRLKVNCKELLILLGWRASPEAKEKWFSVGRIIG